MQTTEAIKLAVVLSERLLVVGFLGERSAVRLGNVCTKSLTKSQSVGIRLLFLVRVLR